MDNKTAQSYRHYNSIAYGYDESPEGRFTLSYNQFICDHVVLRDNDTVLDVACGSGRLLSMLLGKACIDAYGIDISEELIKAARIKHADIIFRTGPADETDFAGNTFDIITVCCAFHHFSKPAAFLREAYRILKPGGKLLIADPLPGVLIRSLENLILPLLNSGDVKLYSKKELTSLLHGAGFVNIGCTKDEMRFLIEGTKV